MTWSGQTVAAVAGRRLSEGLGSTCDRATEELPEKPLQPRQVLLVMAAEIVHQTAQRDGTVALELRGPFQQLWRHGP